MTPRLSYAVWSGALALLLLVGTSGPAFAQNSPDVPDSVQPPDYSLQKLTNGPRSSPFDPGEESDRRFVVDDAPGLDTGCTFRSGGPLEFDVEITRYVGEVDGNGQLVNASALIGNGVINSTATLTMPAFDVDANANVTSIAPEVDRVLVNGEEVGFLDGLNNTWIQNSFNVPVSLLKFPERASPGSTPTPALNRITIEIDVANAPATEAWCTSIDWAAIAVKTVSPVILVHGNNSDAGYWNRLNFTDELSARLLPFDGCGAPVCENPINLPTTFVADNGATLLNEIPPIVESFGADSYHLVVHSKGGLDSREYLVLQGSEEPKALSFTSLSTPHDGSALADLLVSRSRAFSRTVLVNYQGIPPASVAGSFSGLDDGTRNLTTQFAAGFNNQNIPSLLRSTQYNTIGADADENQNGTLDRNPDEFDGARAESELLSSLDNVGTGNFTLSRAAINVPYGFLRDVQSVDVNFRTINIGPISIPRATVVGTPTPAPRLNDTLVPIVSAFGNAGGFRGLVTNRQAFVGPNGRDHGDVADDGVARTVIPWILNVEENSGDLKRKPLSPAALRAAQ